MKVHIKTIMILCLLFACSKGAVYAQAKENIPETQTKAFKKSGKKIEAGIRKNNSDTLAEGYYNFGENYYQQGDIANSETYFQKAKNLYEQVGDASGIAKSSRALAKAQEALNKKTAAAGNYAVAQKNNIITGDSTAYAFNSNDYGRVSKPMKDSSEERLLKENIKIGLIKKDTTEIISNYSRLGKLNLSLNNTQVAASAYTKAYSFSKYMPQQALQINQQLTDVYLKDKNFTKAIETKQQVLKEPFVQGSTQLQAKEITSLANIYLEKNEATTAVELLQQSYALSVVNGHTMQAKENIQKLDSFFQATGQRDKSLALYKDFLAKLPGIISKDSSLADARVVAETEIRIKELEDEKALKDDLIRRKNIFNYWLIGSVAVLAVLIAIVVYTLRKLRVKNKKIALQSLRREMNPHFIFNSLNSINQFIANNNELAANQYLTKFSTLMRRVMENSTNDFVLFTKETELLQHYLELEKSRFPDKFDFEIHIDDALLAEEELYIPGMLVQPHLENAIWHGLRYSEEKGLLSLRFAKAANTIQIMIEDNGIGIAESKKHKTANQKKREGRGIANTHERIAILNELYRRNITCTVVDKQAPQQGVKVEITVPFLKNFSHEN
jgi:tetratricopeptide (TPR) repeat protein